MTKAAAKHQLRLPADTTVDAEVDLGTTGGEFFLQARLSVSLPGIDRPIAQTIIEDAHQICPYSKANCGEHRCYAHSRLSRWFPPARLSSPSCLRRYLQCHAYMTQHPTSPRRLRDFWARFHRSDLKETARRPAAAVFANTSSFHPF